ncbi:histidine kinase [Phycicoccus sp. SLBN-51]|uniref:histidine kinase n=1 Tax=Phycicoccus sp. SLBN-51 TaxID=2768447 RepID=UPI00116A0B68|nr:histidine kinase [Phycicoccus sp. SLBN-51]TQJ51671.1 histidine kinase [Phycicoccus sp. SLBN-51]
MRWLPRLSMATLIRIGFALASLTIAALTHSVANALPWVLLVMTLDLIATGLLSQVVPTRTRRMQALAVLSIAALASGAAMAYGGIGPKALIVIPAFNVGLHYRPRWVLWITGVGAATGFGIASAEGVLNEDITSRMLLWTLGAALIGLLGALSRQMEMQAAATAAVSVDPSLAAEASMLLRRLHELADSLDTGFDAPASAEMALQDLAGRTRSARSAILVGYGDDPAVPLAIRGADRTPWPDPTETGSVLWQAWNEGEPTLSVWDGDYVERSVMAVPMYDETGKRLGVLVADRPAMTPFSEDDLAAAVEVAASHSAHIDLSVVFASLRERAGLEERERLAREMHDGIAQEMVALGFGLDSVRRRARDLDSPIAEDLDGLRKEVSRVLADLRLHIADLRIAVRPDTGLGAMIGSRLQSFGSATGMTTRMHLSETGFRLPAHTEVLIYRLFLQVLTDARHAADTTSMDVRLNVAAPRAELWVSHNGTSQLKRKDFTEHPLRALGAEITVDPYGERGVSVRMRMRARGAAPSATLSHERIPQPS